MSSSRHTLQSSLLAFSEASLVVVLPFTIMIFSRYFSLLSLWQQFKKEKKGKYNDSAVIYQYLYLSLYIYNISYGDQIYL